MKIRSAFASTNIFLTLGLVLVILSLVLFPTRVEFQDQSEVGGSEHYNVGWLFAPIVGAWGLASLAVGLVQSTRPRWVVTRLLIFISAFVCVGLVYGCFLVVFYGLGIVASVGRGEPFFLLYYGLILAPGLIVLFLTIRFMRAGERGIFAVSKKIKAAVFALLAIVPLAYSIAFLASIYLL